jgi:hypothetical protein
MDRVMARGFPDNASLQVVHILSVAPTEEPTPSRLGWLSGMLGRRQRT